MSDRYRLVALNNEQLVAALAGLVRRENDAQSDVLAHLAELDERRLYLDLGFSSLFAYCTEVLGFCKSSAGRRIAAARVCRKYPEAFVRVAKGELQLSVLSMLAQHLNPENATGLFADCSGKSFEQVELLLAVRFPKPDVRDSIRRLPPRPDPVTPDIGSALTTGAADTAGGAAMTVQNGGQNRTRETVAPTRISVPALALHPASARGRIEPLSANRFGVRFTADAEFRELLEEVRALASHSLPAGELLPLLKRGLEAYRRELQKTRFGVGRRARGVVGGGGGESESESDGGGDGCAAAGRAKRTRHVPTAVARAVYLRDEGCRTFMAQDGRRCGTRRFLELDHMEPWAHGGESTLENLRLRCRAHNQHAARAHFGSERIGEAVARARSKNRREAALD